MVLIAAAVMVFAVIAGITIYQRIQSSEPNGASRRNSGVSPVSINNGNDLNPPSLWNAQTNGASTKATMPLSKPSALGTK